MSGAEITGVLNLYLLFPIYSILTAIKVIIFNEPKRINNEWLILFFLLDLIYLCVNILSIIFLASDLGSFNVLSAIIFFLIFINFILNKAAHTKLKEFRKIPDHYNNIPN